jgi:hypothetical protein
LSAPLLRLLAPRFHLLVVLVLLIAIERAHDLAPQLAASVGIARAALGMGLRVLVNKRLNVLLLVAGQVESGEPLHPPALDFSWARSRLAGLHSLRLTLLGTDAKRHRERYGQRADRQEVDFHGSILAA